MNKKIILLVAVLLIVAIVFVACKGKDDVEGTTESTTESTTEAMETTSSKLELNPVDDEDIDIVIPDVYDENAMSGEGVIHIGGDSDEESGEDSISWEEIVGKNS